MSTLRISPRTLASSLFLDMILPALRSDCTHRCFFFANYSLIFGMKVNAVNIALDCKRSVCSQNWSLKGVIECVSMMSLNSADVMLLSMLL